jgi:hypothetical protein
MAINKPVFYRSVTEIEARAAEMGIGSGQFVTGCNRGVANGAIGINTGDYDPKESNFPHITHFAGPVSYIGKLESAVAEFEDNMYGITGDQLPALNTTTRVGFDTAASATAPDADYGSLPLTNYTGKTIPADGWAWGFEAAGGSIVAPIVDAGADQHVSIVLVTTLDGSVVVGSDLSPVILWTIVSSPFGGGGSFADDSSLTSQFTGVFAGAYVLALTATPDDGPPVVDTVNISLGEG